MSVVSGGQGDLGEDVVAVVPGGAQAAEGGAVVEPVGGEAVVGAVEVDGPGVGGRPGGGVVVRGGAAGCDGAGGVPGPGAVGVGVRGPGVEVGAASAVGVGGPEVQLDLDGAVLGEDQRCGEGEVVDAVAAGVLSGVPEGLDDGGARYEDVPVDAVVGEPGVGVPGESSGVDGLVAGEVDGGAEQRMPDSVQPRSSQVTRPTTHSGPVTTVLEGIGRQLDNATTGRGRRPVSRTAGHPHPAQRRQRRHVLRATLTQHRHRDRVRHQLTEHRRQHTARPHLHEPDHTRSRQSSNPIGEPHRVPHMRHPELRIGDLPRHLHRNHRLDEGQRPDDGPELLQHRLHQHRVEGVRDCPDFG